jgi:hypothetical protein
MEPTPDLADALDRDRREAAAAMTPGERVLAGPTLFDLGLALLRAGIRRDRPEASDEAVERIVVDRLRRAREHEETV